MTQASPSPRPIRAATVAARSGRDAGILCERCAHEMYDRHCKVVCPNCGYLRDCSDP